MSHQTTPVTPAQDAHPRTSSERGGPMRAADQKSGSGAVGVVGPVLAVLLTALGLLLLRDALVAAGALGGSQWLPAAATGLRGFGPAWWLIPAGLLIALLGLWLIVTAVQPRSRKTLPLTSETGVFLHTRDVARLASGAAHDVDGVLDVSSVATRRKVTVSVRATASTGVREAVSAAVTDRLSALQSPPRVTVRVENPRGNSDRSPEEN